jgi:hypothetical protein
VSDLKNTQVLNTGCDRQRDFGSVLKLLAVKQTEKERVSESFLVALLTQNRERIEGKKEE